MTFQLLPRCAISVGSVGRMITSLVLLFIERKKLWICYHCCPLP